MATNKYDPSMPTPNELAQRYKNKFREGAVSKVFDLMRKNNVSVEDIIAYVAAHDSNRSPLEKIRQFKANHGHFQEFDVQTRRPEPEEAVSDNRGNDNTSGKTPDSSKGTLKTVLVKSRPNP